MSLSSNNSQVDLTNPQPDAVPNPNTVPNPNVINAPVLLAVLQQLLVILNQGVGIALLVHANTGIGNLSIITVNYQRRPAINVLLNFGQKLHKLFCNQEFKKFLTGTTLMQKDITHFQPH